MQKMTDKVVPFGNLFESHTLRLPFEGFNNSFLGNSLYLTAFELEELHENADSGSFSYRVDFEKACKAYITAYLKYVHDTYGVCFNLVFDRLVIGFNGEKDELFVKVSRVYPVILTMLGRGGMPQDDTFKQKEYQENIKTWIKLECMSYKNFKNPYESFINEWQTKSVESMDYNELSLFLPHPDYKVIASNLLENKLLKDCIAVL